MEASGDILEVSFLEHISFSREIKKFNNKYDGGIGFNSLKKLLSKHFHPTKSQLKLPPQVLRRVDKIGSNIMIYKVVMRVKNLRQGQSPRVCLRVAGNLITFLCFGTHIDNYKDSQLKETIKKRIKDLDSEVQFK